MIYLGFDPGKDKCGVAVVDSQGQIHHQAVVASIEVMKQIQMLCQQWHVAQIIIGDRTTSRQWQQQLQEVLPDVPVVPVNEHRSTLEARDLYWQMYPAQGLQKLIPEGMRLPPRPIDDLVAIILVRRHLELLEPST